MVVSADGARVRGPRTTWTGPKCDAVRLVLAASARGTAAERSGRAPACWTRGANVLTKGVRHRHASVERIKLHSEHGGGTWFSSSARAASANPWAIVWNHAARGSWFNKALRGFDCEW